MNKRIKLKTLIHFKYVIADLPSFKGLPHNTSYNLQGYPEGNLELNSIFAHPHCLFQDFQQNSLVYRLYYFVCFPHWLPFS